MLGQNFKNLLALTLVATMTSASAHAGLFGHKDKSEKEQTTESLTNVLNAAIPADQENMQRQALQALASAMVPKLTEIQKLIDEAQPEAALTLAKATLDEVRIKTGIDPKAKLRENFLISTVFPAEATNMDSLSVAQQQIVIRTVKDFRGGLYLDILNLSKRTTLLYIKAFHQQIVKSSKLNKEDRNKIIKDLAVATLVPMPIQDKNGKVINVFDEEVANEDHTYMFNREMKMYLISSNDLEINEDAFIEYREQIKSSMVAGNAGTGNGSSDISGNSKQCLANATAVEIGILRYSALETCYRNHIKATSTYASCRQFAGQLEFSDLTYAATKYCTEKFVK